MEPLLSTKELCLRADLAIERAQELRDQRARLQAAWAVSHRRFPLDAVGKEAFPNRLT